MVAWQYATLPNGVTSTLLMDKERVIPAGFVWMVRIYRSIDDCTVIMTDTHIPNHILVLRGKNSAVLQMMATVAIKNQPWQ